MYNSKMEDKSRTLYCGNLCEKVTEDLLYELFLQAGPLESVTMPKDKEGKHRKFAFITFKHAVSVPYTIALMNGITLFGKTLKLDARTGAESDHDPYLEKLIQYRNSLGHEGLMSKKCYSNSPRDRYDKRSHVYDERRFDTRGEAPRTDYNSWNQYPSQISQYNMPPPPPVVYGIPLQNQARFSQNNVTQVSYPNWYGNQMPWSRGHS